MRGGTKLTVVVLHAVATTTSAALVGLVLGVLGEAARLPVPSAPVVVGVVVVALLADLAWGVAGRPRPVAVRTQVPIVWSQLFDPRTVAVLYGLRLGVGPLTLLPTWLWWAAVGLGAAAGLWVSVAVGMTFGVVRAVTTMGLGEVVRTRPVQRMAFVQRSATPVALACAAVVVIAAGALLV